RSRSRDLVGHTVGPGSGFSSGHRTARRAAGRRDDAAWKHARTQMKSPYVSELEPDRVITTTFLVHSKEIRQKKTGDPYLSLQLGDRTGDLDGKMWDNVAEVMETFDRDDFIKVKGLIQIFHNRPQLTIHKMRRAGDHEIEFADYFPASERNSDEMLAQLRGIVAVM